MVVFKRSRKPICYEHRPIANTMQPASDRSINTVPQAEPDRLDHIYEEYTQEIGLSAQVADSEHTAHPIDQMIKRDDETQQSWVMPESNPHTMLYTALSLVDGLNKRDTCLLYLNTGLNPIRSKQRYEHDPNLRTNITTMLNLMLEHSSAWDDYECEQKNAVQYAYDQAIDGHVYPDELLLNIKNPDFPLANLQDLSRPVTVSNALNTFLTRLYEYTHSHRYQEALRARIRRARDHLNTAEAYLLGLRKQGKRLLALRIDLRFPDAQKNITVDQAQAYFQSLLQKLRRKTGFHLEGYIWKLEFGLHTGLHYHCLFFLDGRYHCQDIKLTQMIGEMWNVIVDGKHCYFNCNHLGYQKRFAGEPIIGRLEPNDEQKYERLLNTVIRYFCKKDQFIMHKSVKNKKTFGTGRLMSTRIHLGRRPKQHR